MTKTLVGAAEPDEPKPSIEARNYDGTFTASFNDEALTADDAAKAVSIVMEALGLGEPTETIIDPEPVQLPFFAPQTQHADWIELRIDPHKTLVNTHTITRVDDADGGAIVLFDNGTWIQVQQTYHTVKKLILGE